MTKNRFTIQYPCYRGLRTKDELLKFVVNQEAEVMIPDKPRETPKFKSVKQNWTKTALYAFGRELYNLSQI